MGTSCKPLANLNVPGVAAPRGARKAQECDVIRSIDYHGFRRVRLNGNAGTLFTLSSGRNVESLRDAYSNVIILAGRSQYAPELSTRYVFVSDKRYNG
jgi:hypothetical protein